MSASGSTLEHRAVHGFLWHYGGFAVGRIVFFVATIVLARTLSPADFGLVAFTLAVITYFESTTGIGETLVFRSDAKDERVASTAFWLGMAISVVFLTVMWIAAPAIASLGPDSDDLVWVVRILSLQLILTALGSVHMYLLRHSIDFRNIFWPQVVSGIVKGGSAIVLALAGAGVWSLVFGQLAGTLTRSAGLWLVSGWRPSFVVAREHLRSLLGVGSGFAAVALLGELARNADYLIVGAKLGTTALGFYYVAFRLPELLILSPFESARQVLFPYYSRVDDAAEDEDVAHGTLARGFVRSIRLGSVLALPVGAAMAALAGPIVLTLYGGQWEDSIAPFTFIALWAATSAVSGMAGTVLKSLGRAGALTAATTLSAAVSLPLLWFAADWNITVVAATQFASKAVWLVLIFAVASRILGISTWQSAGALVPGLAISVGVAAVALPAAQLSPSWLALVAGLVLSSAAYLLLVRLVCPDVFRLALDTVRSRRARKDVELSTRPA